MLEQISLIRKNYMLIYLFFLYKVFKRKKNKNKKIVIIEITITKFKFNIK
jgi:hypothetical protein